MSNDKVEYARGRKNGSGADLTMEIDAINKGVTLTWLAQAFGVSLRTAKEKLRKCPHSGVTKTGYLYDLREAAPYLIKPVMNVKEYLKSVRPEELPTKLQDKYWSALMRRIKYEERAGMLWRTEKVLFVLGEMFQTIKFSLQLWADNLERATGITPEQRTYLRDMVDGLQDEIYTKIKELEKESKTSHVLGEGTDVDEEDDEDFDLIGEDEEEEDLIG
ncbi:MAG: DUF1441 family protein [Alphaproteobacteria bacterium]|nr:DUF1441 family protein [Alphaproteobacteria bacterium]